MHHKQLGISLDITGGKWYAPVLPDIHPWNSQDPLVIWSRVTFCPKRRLISYRAHNYTNVISIGCIWPLRILRESLFANPFILPGGLGVWTAFCSSLPVFVKCATLGSLPNRLWITLHGSISLALEHHVLCSLDTGRLSLGPTGSLALPIGFQVLVLWSVTSTGTTCRAGSSGCPVNLCQLLMSQQHYWQAQPDSQGSFKISLDSTSFSPFPFLGLHRDSFLHFCIYFF